MEKITFYLIFFRTEWQNEDMIDVKVKKLNVLIYFNQFNNNQL